MFNSNQFFGGGAGDFYPKTIDQSLRFNDNDSAYLSRTPASAGDNNTWTWSGWVKRANIDAGQIIFGCTITEGANYTIISFNASNTLQVTHVYAGVFQWGVGTSQLFRDSSAWYHIVVAVDMDNATEADRNRIYVNGQRITQLAYSTLPSGASSYVNSTNAHAIGRYGTSQYFDGYLAEVHFTDGTAYDADAFGELKSGVWVAKSPSVTYGTNGFYLDFATSGDGTTEDQSGEGNNWTESNLTASDVVLDSPTDNFATLNPLHKNTQAQIYSDGNLRFQSSGSTTQFSAVVASQTADTGKWYCEYTVNSPSNRSICGFVNIDEANIAGAADYYAGIDAYGAGLYSNGGEFLGTTASLPAAGALLNGDVVMLAMNLDDGYLYWGKNGTWFNSADPAAGTSTGAEAVDDIGADGTYAFVFAGRNSMITDVNFGQLGFTYTPPTDYLALSTANLPEPTISPADDASPSDYFGTLLWTGNDASSRTIATGESGITGDVNFTPDFVWLKNRTVATVHNLYDAVRTFGSNKQLSSELTNAEGDISVYGLTSEYGFVSSATTDGFNVSAGSIADSYVNDSGRAYVAWNWKANGSGVSNTDGSITSTVSANTEAGFSIVGWTGNDTDGATIGHGLSSSPEFIITKNRDLARNWLTVFGNATFTLHLNTTEASPVSTGRLDDIDDTIFTVGNHEQINNSSYDYIAYCFHSVEGFSKFGSYTGNGSADGPFVYTGFRPAFVMIKQTNTTGNWTIWDAERNQYNVMGKQLYPNLSNAEADAGTNSSFGILDFTSNGVKLRGSHSSINTSGGTYIFMAFSDANGPFKYSNAR